MDKALDQLRKLLRSSFGKNRMRGKDLIDFYNLGWKIYSTEIFRRVPI
jgi:hypothetical protein